MKHVYTWRASGDADRRGLPRSSQGRRQVQGQAQSHAWAARRSPIAATRTGETVAVVSGLDWSGDAGDPRRGSKQNPWLALAIAHLDAGDLPTLVDAVAGVRSALNDRTGRPFKHQTASARADRAFFDMLRGFSFTAHAVMVDKTELGPPGPAPNWGWLRIRDAATELVLACPDEVVGRQRLLVDLPRSENRLVRDLATHIRQALRRASRGSFRDVKACPDDRPSGELIQIADMIAGELRELGGNRGPHLPRLGDKLRIVGQQKPSPLASL